MSTAQTADIAAAQTALDQILDPVSGQGLVKAGLVQGLVVRDGRAGFMLEAPAGQAAAYAQTRALAEQALTALPGVSKAQVVLTMAAPVGTSRVRKGAKVADDPLASPNVAAAERPAHVRRVIAVASGKGGVGKSTVAVNLACAMARQGLKVGLLDADVYGPSAPRMMGVDGEPSFEDGKLQPLTAHGVKIMSIGFLVDEGRAMIWRGPMASSAVRQMVSDVAWGSEADPLDLLIVDLPPGTGDIHQSLVQKVKIDGVIIVTTPQEIALIDVRRGAELFRKMGTPILGVVETMSWFPDPTTGAPIPIFGRGGGRSEAQRLGVPLLAEIPIDMALREGGDNGRPVGAYEDGGPAAEAFRALAKRLA